VICLKFLENGIQFSNDLMIFECMFEALSDDPDMEYARERCHHDCSRSSLWTWRRRGTQTQAIGRSRGGWTTKIPALTDSLGNLVRFCLLPGNRYDTIGVASLIDGVSFRGIIADKAFDARGGLLTR